MSGKRFTRSLLHRLRRTLMCLALLAFALRAMVPVGFMPGTGTGAGESGHAWVTLCSAGSPAAYRALHPVQPEEPAPAHDPGRMKCPYAMLAAQSLGACGAHLDVPAPALLAVGPAYRVSRRAASRVRMPGPPLGSRAPPLRSGPVHAHRGDLLA